MGSSDGDQVNRATGRRFRQAVLLFLTGLWHRAELDGEPLMMLQVWLSGQEAGMSCTYSSIFEAAGEAQRVECRVC